jgi:predicted amidohydrolase
LIDSGSEGLKGIMKVAMESDSPRAYEVLGNMIKTLADINVNLMDVSAKFAETNKVTIKNNTTNSIFVGTTKDLQNLIKKQNEVVEVDVNEQSEKRLQIESES